MKGKFKEIVSKFPGWLDLLQKSPSVEGLGEFVNSFVHGSSRLTNIQEEVPVFWISMRWVGIGRHL